MGVIPQEAAEEIGRKAKLELLDLESVHEGYLHSRNSLMPLLSGLSRACGKGHGEVEQAIEDIERKRELDPETLGETDERL